MLLIGLLWFDDTKCESVEKIKRAIAHYQARKGFQPNVCCVSPMLPLSENDRLVNGVKVLPSKSILPNHFWLGVEEQPRRGASPKETCSDGVHG